MYVDRQLEIETDYGRPSEPITVGTLKGVPIAFVSRHDACHSIPPHKVPYKANLAALKQLGVRHVLATCVAGSLRREIGPGSFVVPDQFINLTWGRDDTFEQDGRRFLHLPMATPYCAQMRAVLTETLTTLSAPCHDGGTVMVIQGPRFSTVAESKMFAQWGGDIINMTQYPECYFAYELGICYAVVASITDHDVGVTGALSMERDNLPQVIEIFRRNRALTHLLVEQFVEHHHADVTRCACAAERLEPYYEQSDDT